MPLPSELTALVERIDRELDRLESDGREAIKIGTYLLNRFPDNFTLIQLMAFVNTSLFYADRARNQIRERVESVDRSEPTPANLQEAGEDISIELGRILETKIRVTQVKTRLAGLRCWTEKKQA
ncbi:MAG: hypothetical protein ACKPBT_18250 [Microcystis aeruginosa]